MVYNVITIIKYSAHLVVIEPVDGDPPLDGVLRDRDVGHAARQHLPLLRVVVHIAPVLRVAVAVLKLHL